MDFADALHLANSQQFDELYTFDKKFIKKSEGLTGAMFWNHRLPKHFGYYLEDSELPISH